MLEEGEVAILGAFWGKVLRAIGSSESDGSAGRLGKLSVLGKSQHSFWRGKLWLTKSVAVLGSRRRAEGHQRSGNGYNAYGFYKDSFKTLCPSLLERVRSMKN